MFVYANEHENIDVAIKHTKQQLIERHEEKIVLRYQMKRIAIDITVHANSNVDDLVALFKAKTHILNLESRLHAMRLAAS